MMGQTTKMSKDIMLSALKGSNINIRFEQYTVLLHLEAEEFPSQQNIARILRKDKSIVLRHIDDLIEKGYVTKVQWENDKRWKRLSLTQNGREVIKQIRKIGNDIEQQLTKGIDQASIDTTVEVLKKIQINGGYESCRLFNKYSEE